MLLVDKAGVKQNRIYPDEDKRVRRVADSRKRERIK
jgi:hypothetical protein